MGTRDGQLLQRYWEETFDISAIDKIKEIYDTQEKQEYLERITKKWNQFYTKNHAKHLIYMSSFNTCDNPGRWAANAHFVI